MLKICDTVAMPIFVHVLMFGYFCVHDGWNLVVVVERVEIVRHAIQTLIRFRFWG